MTAPSLADHIATLQRAITRVDLTPNQLRWHYIQLAFCVHGGNVSHTARALGMHRRTLQRMLAANAPGRVGANHG